MCDWKLFPEFALAGFGFLGGVVKSVVEGG